MKRRSTSPKAKDANEPFHLSSFGGITELYFNKGGYARAQFNTLEINRLIEALQRYALRKQRVPDPKVLEALSILEKFFSTTGKGFDVTVTADIPIAGYGVRLEPILEEL